MENNRIKIGVLGAGVVGMTVSNLLQDEFRNAKVTIIADKFKEDTTSAVAAGIFRPGTSFKGPNAEITKKWLMDSWDYWQDILKTSEAPQAGIMSFSCYIFSKHNYHVTRNHLLEDIVPIYRPVSNNELKICGDSWKFGSFFTTLKIGCERYLPWVEKHFLDRDGTIAAKTITTFSDLGQFDLVFNCAGLGAKYLCNDYDLVPMRGQVIKVRAPWLKTAFYGDYDTYVIPGFDGIATLGGVRQYDSYNLDICKHDAAAIKERCCELVPGLKKAEIVQHKVGLRPHRIPVRVDTELIANLRVVHCYGHGGYGVMCAPGTAKYAVKMAADFWRSNLKNKSKL